MSTWRDLINSLVDDGIVVTPERTRLQFYSDSAQRAAELERHDNVVVLHTWTRQALEANRLTPPPRQDDDDICPTCGYSRY